MNNFSENIKKIRKDNNLSQEGLAEELGVSRQAVSKWESGIAYPEMDKIINLCNKFNVNIDDLLNNDINEVKGEDTVKSKLNNHIDSFLNFITDTINLFSSMNFKSKIKCLFEQIIIGLGLTLIFFIIGDIIENFLYSISFSLSFYTIIKDVFSSIYFILVLGIGVCIMTHIFKTRYLNYYLKVKNKNIDVKSDNDNNIIFKEEDKIIIRDPMHSEYHFINGIFKIIVFSIKIFTSFILVFFCFLLILLFAGFIISFLIIKSSLFVGLIISLFAMEMMCLVVVLFLFNFIFNRKCDKKKMIWSFTLSLVILGIGIGLICIGSLKLDINYKDEYLTDNIKIEMSDDFFFNYDDIIYVEDNIKDVLIEYTISKYCDVDYYNSKYGSYLCVSCSNPIKIIRQFIDGVNNDKIMFIDDGDIYNIKIYASKDNILKIKNNYNKYYQEFDY